MVVARLLESWLVRRGNIGVFSMRPSIVDKFSILAWIDGIAAWLLLLLALTQALESRLSI